LTGDEIDAVRVSIERWAEFIMHGAVHPGGFHFLLQLEPKEGVMQPVRLVTRVLRRV